MEVTGRDCGGRNSSAATRLIAADVTVSAANGRRADAVQEVEQLKFTAALMSPLPL